MVDIAHLQSILTSLRMDAADLDVVKLAGDASNRTYYRVAWRASGTPKSLILMVLADPELFKASEEAMTGPPPPVSELPFINIQRHLCASGVAVPEIVHYSPGKGWILLEDLGDVTLEQEVVGAGLESVPTLFLYQKAIDELIQIQRFATPQTTHPTLAHYRAFDQSLFMWEFDHFIEYGIEKREGVSLPDKIKKEIRGFFSDIALRLATLPPVFVHRDYHSRNLMVQRRHGDSFPVIRVIDFQDALMGPCQYDLASLLRDAYIDLPAERIDDLISYYLAVWEERTGEKMPPASFKEIFDLISIQRQLKAVGRFIYIDQVKKNPRFLPYVSKTLLKVKKTLETNGRLHPLQRLLAEFVKEFR